MEIGGEKELRESLGVTRDADGKGASVDPTVLRSRCVVSLFGKMQRFADVLVQTFGRAGTYLGRDSLRCSFERVLGLKVATRDADGKGASVDPTVLRSRSVVSLQVGVYELYQYTMWLA